MATKRVLQYSILATLAVMILAGTVVYFSGIPSADTARAYVSKAVSNHGIADVKPPSSIDADPLPAEEFLARVARIVDREQGIQQQAVDSKRMKIHEELAWAVPKLIQFLGTTSDETMAFKTCSVLERIGYILRETHPNVLKPAEGVLLAYMQSDVKYPQKGMAAQALAHIRPLSDDSVGAIVSELDTPGFQSNGFIALASAMDYSDLANSVVMDALKSATDPYRSFLAAQGIIMSRQYNLPRVQHIMDENLVSDQAYVRGGAISYFVRFSETHPDIAWIGKDNLIRNIKRPSTDNLKPEAIRAASYAYGALEGQEGSEEILDALIECALDPGEAQMSRVMAIAGITAFAHTSEKVHRAIATLKQDEDPEIRREALNRSTQLR